MKCLSNEIHGGVVADPNTKSQWISGKLNWFDPVTLRGSIIGDDGIFYRINEFSELINSKENWLKKDCLVEFKLTADSVYPVIKSIRSALEIKKFKLVQNKKREKESSI